MHGEKAKANFLQGYNCSQAIVAAFADEIDIPFEMLMTLVSPRGGGLGRLREVCGTVTGAAIVLGAKYGYSRPKDFDGKKTLYKYVQEFARRFKEINGSYICRELLAGVGASTGGEPEKRTEDYYKKRPCPELCKISAEILDDLIDDIEHGKV